MAFPGKLTVTQLVRCSRFLKIWQSSLWLIKPPVRKTCGGEVELYAFSTSNPDCLGAKLTVHLHPVTRLWVPGAITSLPLMLSWLMFNYALVKIYIILFRVSYHKISMLQRADHQSKECELIPKLWMLWFIINSECEQARQPNQPK